MLGNKKSIDCKRGKYAENEFFNFLQSTEEHTEIILRDYFYWDIELINGKSITKYEIKLDDFSYEIYEDNTVVSDDGYGTLLIEFESEGKPSGISTTKADFFVIVVKKSKEFWIIKTENLKRVILMNEKYIQVCGDNNSSKAYLILKEKNRKFFEIIKYGDGKYTREIPHSIQYRLE